MEKYVVLEIFSDNHTIARYRSDDYFECEVYVEKHKYDYGIIRAKSKLAIKQVEN